MKRNQAAIPLHKLSDRHASGISVQFIQSVSIQEKEVMRAHRDDHYIFIFQQEGESKLMVDFEEVTIQGPAVHCVLPGQVHYYISSHHVSGWFLAIETLLVPESYRHVFEEMMLKLIPVQVTASQAEYLQHCVRVLYHLLGEEERATRRSVIGHLVSAYIGLIADCFSIAGAGIHPGNRVADIARQFRVALRNDFRKEKSPAQYAAALNLSLTYLNECVKTATGMPVSYWIRQEIALEARRLLYYSAFSVKEIAFELGYEDPTYFSRMFVKTVGMSPGQFRRSYRE